MFLSNKIRPKLFQNKKLLLSAISSIDPNINAFLALKESGPEIAKAM